MTELKVFIVEDNAVIRQNLVGALEEMAPVKVVGHAEGATAARTVLSAMPPTCDLVIVDIFLRDGNGLDLLRMLNDQRNAMARVVLTHYATADIRDKCLAMGAARVFDKSTDIDALVDYCTELRRKAADHGAA